MMGAKYRKISTRIWSDAKFCSCSDDAQLLFLFTLTHPHMTSVGAMRATVNGLAVEKKWPQKRAVKAFAELFEKGLLEANEMVIVAPNFVKHNPPENPNVVKAWRTSFDELPECELILKHFNSVKEFVEGLPESFREGFGEPLPEGFGKTGTGAGTGAGKTYMPKPKFELPDWVPEQQWRAWIDSRQNQKKNPTDFAKRLAVAKLAELRDAGHHPAAVLAQSAFNGWAGLFPVKEQRHG